MLNQEGISDTKLSSKCDVDNIYYLSSNHKSTCNISSAMPTPKNDNKKLCTTDSKMNQELIVKLENMLLKNEQFLNLPKKSKLDPPENIITRSISWKNNYQ